MDRKHFLKLLGVTPFLFGMKNLQTLNTWQEDLPNAEKAPALFIGHGSPMNAIEENEFVKGFRDIAKSFAKPKAILSISAHWYIRGTKVTAMENPKTIHDMYGFPQALYDVRYPASGNPELATEIVNMLPSAKNALDNSWGLDHGTWSVLMHMYPNADIPVLQMSIDATQSPEFHFELGKTISKLRNKGVLILGSGNLIHNLRLVDFANMHTNNYGFDWAIEAREILNKAIEQRDLETLFRYERKAKALELAIPTPDHYLPLLYVLGTEQDNEKLSFFNDKLQAGSLSMTSVKLS